jgi:dTDP-4-dehydrorhamnose reductase
MKRIFILGADGMLGWISNHYLKNSGFLTIPLSRDNYNAKTDPPERLELEHKITKEDILINAIGITNRHDQNTSIEDFEKINADFPKSLDIIARRTSCKLIHITTDCVYKGDQGGYWESSKTDSEEIYGKSKAKGENLYNAVIIRTSIVGVERKHFYNLISWVIQQEGGVVNGFTNHTWNGITTLHFAKIVKNFIDNGFPQNGLYHIFSKRIVTKYELVKSIARVFKINITLQLHQTNKPVLRHLSTEKTLNDSLAIPDIEDQLIELKAYCEDNNISWKSI